ncbi:FAD-dependent oxidoreductase [candidate division KSB1 bacterium]
MNSRFSRRDFIKTGSAAAVLPLMGSFGQGCSASGGSRSSRSGKNLKKEIAADLVIVGGGLAGVTAALAAARHGLSVVLVQDRPVLGGNSSSEIRIDPQGANWAGNRPNQREGGVIEELQIESHVKNPQRCAKLWDFTLWEALYREAPRVTVLLNTTMTGCRLRRGEIEQITALQFHTETEFTIGGKFFLDSSGDGVLGYRAGNPFRSGREARSEFDEPLAPAEPSPYVQGSTLMFTARDMGQPMPFTPPDWAYDYPTEESLPINHWAMEQITYGYTWIEWGGLGGAEGIIHDDDTIREELLKVLFGAWDHIKNHGDHGADNYAIDWFGFLPGRRESRRLVGAYTLTQNDLAEAKVFDDEIAHGGWPIDSHQPEGFRAKSVNKAYPLDKAYSIPLRCLYSQEIPNLFFAGRDISASHIALSSTRVMATCSLLGQAVGTAAALCQEKGTTPNTLSETDIETLKQSLLRDDIFLIGTTHSDPLDLARDSKVTAGSNRDSCEPARVIDGRARNWGEELHLWASTSLDPRHAWIQLDLGASHNLGEIQLAFDTNYTRPLTFSLDDRLHRKMASGPQPETVKDFDISIRKDGSWSKAAEIRDNYQRLRRVDLDGLPGDAVRIDVRQTNGLDHARIFEIRCYETER